MVHFALKTCPEGIDNPQDPRFRILIVDDQEGVHDLLRRIFELRIGKMITAARVEVVSAFSLKEGLSMADGANVTILDLQLEDSSPDNTIAHIHHFRPPVIVMTGDGRDETRERCKEQQAAYVFVKPNTAGLIQAVVDCLWEDLRRLNPALAEHEL